MQRKHGDVLTELGEAKERENSLVQSLEKAVAEHVLEIEQLEAQLDEARKAHEDAEEQDERELQQRTLEDNDVISQAQKHDFPTCG